MHNVIQDGKLSYWMSICLLIYHEVEVMAMQSISNYLTTVELSKRIKYDCRTIREQLKDSVLIEGTHYFRPFGGRKILYDWEAIQRDMKKFSQQAMAIPMSNGGVSHG